MCRVHGTSIPMILARPEHSWRSCQKVIEARKVPSDLRGLGCRHLIENENREHSPGERVYRLGEELTVEVAGREVGLPYPGRWCCGRWPIGPADRHDVDRARPPRFTPVHDRSRILTDTAVMIADGGRGLSDLAVLRDQGEQAAGTLSR